MFKSYKLSKFFTQLSFCISRYAILTKQTFPKWNGEDKDGIVHILKASNINTDEYQLGKTMVFVKAPESVRSKF